MNVARILYPVEVLGPGKRIGIWLAGCQHHCKGCSNPELWEQKESYEVSVDNLYALLRHEFADKLVDGFVISGGEPFLQANELGMLLHMLLEWSRDILVYTGYTVNEIKEMHNPNILACLESIGVLIDGRYIEELNDGARLRGSSNQRIIYFGRSLQMRYESYMAQSENRIQNFSVRDGVISVGIHKADFAEEIIKRVSIKGMVIKDG